MSRWTHITGSVFVDTYKRDENNKHNIEAMLKLAPPITGSEGNADYFVNIPSGYNSWGSDGDFQTRAVITINGDLRDREPLQTEQELEDLIDFLVDDCDFNIRNQSVSILP